MPLLLTALTSMPGLPGAQGDPYPETTAGAAAEWAGAIRSWAEGIVPPSTTVAAAAAALEGQLATIFAAREGTAALLEQAFATFALAVGAGMAGYVATPPPGPVGFAAFFLPPYAPDRPTAIDRVAQLLDAWMRTGTAALIAPPFTVLTWS